MLGPFIQRGRLRWSWRHRKQQHAQPNVNADSCNAQEGDSEQEPAKPPHVFFVSPLLAAQRLGDELPAARVANECRPPAAAVQTTMVGGRRIKAIEYRRLRPVSSIALLGSSNLAMRGIQVQRFQVCRKRRNGRG